MTGKAVSDNKLDIENLKSSRDKLLNSINISRIKATDAHDHNKISSSDFQEAQKKWEKLEIKESELSGQIMNLQLNYLLETNVNSPMSKITQATDKLDAAATDIQNFQHFLDSIADVINIFDSLIKAIPSGVIAII